MYISVARSQPKWLVVFLFQWCQQLCFSRESDTGCIKILPSYKTKIYIILYFRALNKSTFGPEIHNQGPLLALTLKWFSMKLSYIYGSCVPNQSDILRDFPPCKQKKRCYQPYTIDLNLKLFSSEEEDECLARELMKKLTPPVLSKLRRCFKKNKERSKARDIDR